MKRFLSCFLFILFWLATAALLMGTVRKKENAILKTQTDPIAYKEKMEEIKDGEKGAPSPTFHYYKKGKFLSELPMENEPQNKQAAKPAIPELGEPIPENLEPQPSEESEDWWFEESEEELPEGGFKDSSGTVEVKEGPPRASVP